MSIVVMDKTFIVQVLITFIIFAATVNCTDPQCTVQGETADCSFKALSTIPTLQPTFKFLNLSGNKLTTLKSNSFSIASRLTNLSITNSHVSVLDKDAFRGLTNLASLDLSHNSIGSINETFRNHLKSLEYLSLQYNFIRRIPQNALDQLVKLKKLNLAHNKLIWIHPHAFNKLNSLTWIAIDHNSLVTASSAWFSPINKTLAFISLGHNPWQCDHKMCGFKNWTQVAKKKWSQKMVEISCSHSNKTLRDFHTKDLCKGNIQEVSLGHDITLRCLDPTSSSWQFMTKSNTTQPLSITKIENNQKTTIKPGKLLLTSAEAGDAGKYCCLDTPSDSESRIIPTKLHTSSDSDIQRQLHTSPHCIILKVNAPRSTKTSKSSGGGSGGTAAVIIILILTTVGGVSFWYFRRKRRNYGLLSDETVFQPSFDDQVESARIRQQGMDESGPGEAYV